MEQENTADSGVPAEVSQIAKEIVGYISQYDDLVIANILVAFCGIIAAYLIHRFAEKFLFPHFEKGRFIKVVGVTIYALILVTTVLAVLRSVGVDVTVLSKIALVIVFMVAILAFILIPLLPTKLPFRTGHLVQVGSELGTVKAISPLYTSLEKSDGALVFIPNTSVVTATIKNFTDIPFRRVDINLKVRSDNNLKSAKEFLFDLMSADVRVSAEPKKPAVFVMNANMGYIELSAVCWVNSEDWFSTRCDLWESIVNSPNDVHLAEPFSNKT